VLSGRRRVVPRKIFPPEPAAQPFRGAVGPLPWKDSVVLDNLREGVSPAEIVRDYPPLSAEDIEAAVACGRVSDTNE
jgi:hypothetical protein